MLDCTFAPSLVWDSSQSVKKEAGHSRLADQPQPIARDRQLTGRLRKTSNIRLKRRQTQSLSHLKLHTSVHTATNSIISNNINRIRYRYTMQLMRSSSTSTGAARPMRQQRAPRACRVHATSPEWTGRQFTMLSTGEGATAHLAKILAEELRPGDSLCLKGDEHAGKGVFA